MAEHHRPRIFWLEEDTKYVCEYIEALQRTYDLTVTAAESEVFVQRELKFQLLILDIMIHKASLRAGIPGGEVKNVSLGGPWSEQGIAFLTRVRAGDYERFGFPRDLPTVVFTAVIDRVTEESVLRLGMNDYLNKPAPVGMLLNAVARALATRPASGEET